MEFCQESMCNAEQGTDAWQADVDGCYAEYETQGLNDPVLGPGWITTCQASLDAWTGCGL